MAARHEGLLLDPVYTAKTMAGLVAHVRAGRIARGSRVLFVHTGGLPALFAYADQLGCWLSEAPDGRARRGKAAPWVTVGSRNRHRLDRDDAHAAGGGALALGDAVDLGEDALHFLPVGAAAAVEAHAPPAALEQLGVEMLLQGADAVADGGGGDAELVGGKGEALVPGGGFEEAQAVERRQGNHESGRREPSGWRQVLRNCTNISFSKRLLRKSPRSAFSPLWASIKGFSSGIWARALTRFYY